MIQNSEFLCSLAQGKYPLVNCINSHFPLWCKRIFFQIPYNSSSFRGQVQFGDEQNYFVPGSSRSAGKLLRGSGRGGSEGRNQGPDKVQVPNLRDCGLVPNLLLPSVMPHAMRRWRNNAESRGTQESIFFFLSFFSYLPSFSSPRTRAAFSSRIDHRAESPRFTVIHK